MVCEIQCQGFAWAKPTMCTSASTQASSSKHMAQDAKTHHHQLFKNSLRGFYPVQLGILILSLPYGGFTRTQLSGMFWLGALFSIPVQPAPGIRGQHNKTCLSLLNYWKWVFTPSPLTWLLKHPGAAVCIIQCVLTQEIEEAFEM